MTATYAERHEELVAIAKERGFNPNEKSLNEWLKERLEVGHNLQAVLIRTILGLNGEKGEVKKVADGMFIVAPSTMRPEKAKIQLSWQNTPVNQLIITVHEEKEAETCETSS